MAEKAKQHRFNQLHIKDLYQRLESLEAAVVAAAAHTAQAPSPPEPAPPPEAELVCKLMLCMVYEQPQPAEIAEAAARLAAQEAAQQAAEQQRRQAAATRLQAAARGFLVRRRLAAQHAAATTIQAATRGFLVRQALATIWEADEAAEEAASAAAVNLPPAQRLALRQREAELHYQRRAAAAKTKPQKRLPARPGSTARGANTAVEAAARRRGLLPTSGESGHGAGAAAVRRASALAILGSGGSSSGSSSSPSRRLSSLAGLGNRSLGQGPSSLLMGAGTGGPSRAEAGVRQGHVVDRASWTGSAAASGKAARTTTSGAEVGGAGSPSGRSVRHGGRVSVVRVPPLDLAQQEGPRQRAGQQVAQAGGQRQAGKQYGEGQRPPPSETQSEEGAQQEGNEGGSPRWQLERSGAPADALAPASGGQPHRRRESLGFGSSKPRA